MAVTRDGVSPLGDKNQAKAHLREPRRLSRSWEACWLSETRMLLEACFVVWESPVLDVFRAREPGLSGLVLHL